MTSSDMTPPHTYAEWSIVFDMLKNKEDDEHILQTMRSGSVEWQSDIAERFLNKLIDVINYRMNGATDKFKKEMSRSHGQERALIQALISFRREIIFLSEAINLPALPDKDRQQYYQSFISQADNIQNSLEESAKKDRSGKLASIIRNNRVNSF